MIFAIHEGLTPWLISLHRVGLALARCCAWRIARECGSFGRISYIFSFNMRIAARLSDVSRPICCYQFSALPGLIDDVSQVVRSQFQGEKLFTVRVKARLADLQPDSSGNGTHLCKCAISSWDNG